MRWSFAPMRSIYLPTQAQWNGFVRGLKRHADVLAAVVSLVGLHFLSDDVTWRMVGGIVCFILSMAIIRWRCEPGPH